MLLLPNSVRIFLAAQPCDMRKGHDGLAALVRELGQDVFDGHLFVFLSKRRDRCKILAWHSGGFVLWYKRFEKGRFKRPAALGETGHGCIDATSLAMLLDGIDPKKVRRPALWQPKKANHDRHLHADVIKTASDVDRRVCRAGAQPPENLAAAERYGGEAAGGVGQA